MTTVIDRYRAAVTVMCVQRQTIHSCKTDPFVENEIYLPLHFPLCLIEPSPEPANCESVVAPIFSKGRTNYFSAIFQQFMDQWKAVIDWPDNFAK